MCHADRFWHAELPGLVSFLENLGIYLVTKEQKAASSEIQRWALDKCEAAKLSLASTPSPPQPSSRETYPIVYGQILTGLEASEMKASSRDVNAASEVLDHIVAGNETSGIALTYLMYEISIHPQVQDQLRSELLTLSPPLSYPGNFPGKQDSSKRAEDHGLPSPRSIDALSLLDAVVMETLRLHAPISGPQPRITPSESTLANSPPLPSGVRISAQAYTLHRNPQVFPSPLIWNPFRWLDASEAQRVEMGHWFWAFGSGGRMCVGSNLALQEIKLIVASVYSNFRTHMAQDGAVEQIDGYTAIPKEKNILLQFERA